MVKYNESIYFDGAFSNQDILCSINFALTNAKSCILTQEEFDKIEEGPRKVEKEWETNTFKIIPAVDEYEPHRVPCTPSLTAKFVVTQLKGYLHCQRAMGDDVRGAGL